MSADRSRHQGGRALGVGVVGALVVASLATACSKGDDEPGGADGAGGGHGTGGWGTGGAPEVPDVTGPRILDPAVIDDGGLAAWETNECSTWANGVHCRYSYFDSEQAPDLAFAKIAIGEDHGCGLDAAGTITCWGAGQEPLEAGETDCSFNDCGQASPPSTTFLALTAEAEYTCGLDPAGAMVCWGLGGTALPGTFVDLDSSETAVCGLTTTGEITCSSATSLTGATYSQLAVSSTQVCGVRAGGIDCVGLEGKSGEFARVAAGVDFACGLLVDGTPYCWGEGLRVAPPAGPLTHLVAADDFACGRHPDGTVECWGEGQEGGTDPSQCRFGQTLLTGTLGGAPVSVGWQLSDGLGSFNQWPGFEWFFDLDDEASALFGGRLVLMGAEALGPEDLPRFALDSGQSVAITNGMLWMPGGVSQPIYCTGPGSTVTRVGDEAQVSLQAMSLLGSCPGTPVAGELRFCSGDFTEGCPNAAMDNGAIDGTVGATAMPSDAAYSLLLGGGTVTVNFNYGVLHWTEDLVDGTISGGILFTDPASVFGGQVVCLGAGSDFVQDGTYANDGVYTFRNLSTLGTCTGAAGTDSLTGCLR